MMLQITGRVVAGGLVASNYTALFMYLFIKLIFFGNII